MAGNRIGSNEHPPGVREKKNNITYRNPPRGCGSFLFDTICPYLLYTAKARQIFLFVCTHRTVGAFFVCRKMAPSAQRPVCPVAPLPRPTAPEFGSHPNFRKRSKSPCTFNREDYGSRIRSLRKKRGLTQEQLAEKMNVSTPYIAKIETGKQTGPVELAVEFAAFFDVSLDYLLVGKRRFCRGTEARTAEWPSLCCPNWRHLSKKLSILGW